MPVEIDGKTFADHKSAVEHLKKSKPEISDPDAYVATVERKMKGGQLRARLQRIAIENPDPDQTYKIVRFYHPSQNRPSRKIKSGLSLEEARAHTNDPKTRKEGVYFDGYDKE
jgi:hypothetical protein